MAKSDQRPIDSVRRSGFAFRYILDSDVRFPLYQNHVQFRRFVKVTAFAR
jgi:hypothetical protein